MIQIQQTFFKHYKINYILFKNIRKILINNNLCLAIDDVITEQVEHTQFVSVIINSMLTWEGHIKTECSKVGKSIVILVSLNDDILLALHLTLIQPYLEDCNKICESQIYGVHLTQLFIKQKKAIRIVTQAEWNAHTEPLFTELRLLPCSI